jgi:hypothetical protein
MIHDSHKLLAMTGKELREAMADNAVQSVALGGARREWLVAALWEKTDAELHAVIRRSVAEAEKLMSAGGTVMMVYDAADVERAYAQQREMTSKPRVRQ